jgi:hypothetical protein
MDHDYFDYSGPSCFIGGIFVAKVGVMSLPERSLQRLVYGPHAGPYPQAFVVHYTY